MQQQAAAAEAYYQQFQTAPAGFTLLGESGGGGGSASLPSHAGTGNVRPSETAAVAFQVASPANHLASSKASSSPLPPAVPVDQVGPTLDRFFALLNKREWRVVLSRLSHDAPGEADSWAADLLPGE